MLTSRSLGFPARTALAAAISSIVATAAPAQDVAIDEIIVTASRRETTVQDLPFNIAAIPGAELEQRRVNNLQDLSRWVPGLTVVGQGARDASIMTVRGLNVLSIDAGEVLGNGSGETVATYLGEIPLYLDFKMKDLDRVEVLMGPQGTLYGSGTLGGAVRYIPRAPETDALSFEAHGSLYDLAQSSGTGHSADASFNIPLIEDKLAVRAAIARIQDPGFIDYVYLLNTPGVSNPQPDFSNPAELAANLHQIPDADDESTTSGRVALLWEASENARVTFNYYFQDQSVGGRTVNHRDSFGTGRYMSAHRYLEPNDRDSELLSVEVVADLGFAELTSATGSADFESLGQRDQTDLLLNFQYGYENFPEFSAYTRDFSHEERMSQELRLVSKGTGPFNWIAGVYYNDFDQDALSHEYTPGYPDFVGFAVPTGDLEYRQTTYRELTERALFGEVGYAFTDALTLTLGGRQFDYSQLQNVAFDLPFIGETNGGEPITVDDDGFLGKINLAYAFNDSVTAYATLSEGFRLGGANAVAPCLDPLPPGQNACALPDELLIKPDRTQNFELGVHSTLNDGGLVLSGAIYTIDWTDIQTLGTTANGGVPISVNGGGAQSRGVELSVATRVGERWNFSGSYAYNDAELTEDAPGLVDGADAFAGDRVAGTPQHQGSFSARYSRMLRSDFELEIAYGLNFTGDVLTKVGNRDDGQTLGGYTVHSGSIGLSRERWSANLYADNLTNKYAVTGVRDSTSFIRDVNGFALRRYYSNVLRPRSLGLEFFYRFGP